MSDTRKPAISVKSRSRSCLFLVCVLLLIAAFADVSISWVYRTLRWQAERTEAIAWMQSQAEFWTDLPVNQNPKLDVPAPMPLRLFGSPGLRSVCVVVTDQNQVEQKTIELKALFPEATNILVVSPGPGYEGRRAGVVNHERVRP